MSKVLNIYNHDRDSVGMTYVYPVISRRAGGVSIGINLNTNNACNWRCVYCQVPDLKRGRAPEVDLAKLDRELRDFLQEILHGDFMRLRVPPEAQRLNDIAISGNGEPTSSKEFSQVIDLVGRVMADFDLIGKIKLVLITNGSLIQRIKVQDGLRKMAKLGGEVWFKLDSATASGRRKVNSTAQTIEKVRDNLRIAAQVCPTWLQTCVFGFDGQPPVIAEQDAYLKFVSSLRAEGVQLQGVLLYGLARPSMQNEAARLSMLPRDWMLNFAAEVEAQGVMVKLSD